MKVYQDDPEGEEENGEGEIPEGEEPGDTPPP